MATKKKKAFSFKEINFVKNISKDAIYYYDGKSIQMSGNYILLPAEQPKNEVELDIQDVSFED